MARGITLTRSIESIYPYNNRGDGFRLVITASDACLMPRHVFLYQRYLLNPHTQLQAEEFVTVATCPDLAHYPADRPDPWQFPAYYRKDTVDAVYASRKLALDAWVAIRERVCELVAALDRKDLLLPIETDRVGAELSSPSHVQLVGGGDLLLVGGEGLLLLV